PPRRPAPAKTEQPGWRWLRLQAGTERPPRAVLSAKGRAAPTEACPIREGGPSSSAPPLEQSPQELLGHSQRAFRARASRRDLQILPRPSIRRVRRSKGPWLLRRRHPQPGRRGGSRRKG